MTTEAQILANRFNAQKSTGPRTDEGKAAVSQNATKHGLTASCDVISSESQDEFNLYRDQLLAELNPAGPVESMLAERVVALSWRLKRIGRIQNQAFDALTAGNTPSPLAKLTQAFLPKGLNHPNDAPSVPDDTLALGRMAVKDFANTRVLDRLLMYERRIENSLYKTLLEIQRLKLVKNINPDPEIPVDHLQPAANLSAVSASPKSQALSEAEKQNPFPERHTIYDIQLTNNDSIMQNKANLPDVQMNVSDVKTNSLQQKTLDNEPIKQSQSNPISTPKTRCPFSFYEYQAPSIDSTTQHFQPKFSYNK